MPTGHWVVGSEKMGRIFDGDFLILKSLGIQVMFFFFKVIFVSFLVFFEIFGDFHWDTRANISFYGD